MATQVTMPQLGESVVEGTVGHWLVAEGERIEAYQPLLEVETDKVNTEIPAPAGGVLLKILVHEGQTVRAGTVLALIGQPDENLPAAEEASPQAKIDQARQVRPGGDGLDHEKPTGREVITPVVAKIAAEQGIDLTQVDIQGSGRGGRITKRDILAYIEQTHLSEPAAEELPAWERPGSGELFKPREEIRPQTQTRPAERHPPILVGAEAGVAASQPEQVIPLSSMRRSIADHMLNSLRNSAQVTTVMEADLSRVVAYRQQNQAEFERRAGHKLTYTPFFVQAIVEGLKAVPQVNSSFTDEGIVVHQHINVGVAVALETGLIVPVIRDADRLSLSGLQRAISDLAERARSGQLKPDEVRDSTFTLTNHGVAGSLLATPIINQSNAGILGVGAIQKRPVVVTVAGVDSIAIKPMCYLSLTFDHRILDGALADRFLAKVVAVLENWSIQTG
jgi:pyruvate/2-oxoglutarate dehydrogenase complex dihydrolipoamide acyltransferase (E2) component